MSSPTVEVFVVGHSDAVLSRVPSAPGITPVDLRPLASRLGHGNLFAESAFLLADEARHSSADFVGMCSASYDAKWPGAPHLFDLPGVARRLDKAQAAGEELLVPAEWMPSAEHHHPGLGAILSRLATTFGLEPAAHCRSPGANTFICHRTEFLRFQALFAQMLTTAIDWYGADMPFAYRCPDCGSVSESGYGRWSRDRHVGYLGERITRLIFSSRPEVTFVRPEDLVHLSRPQRLRARGVARWQRTVGRSPGNAVRDEEHWHRSADGVDDEVRFEQCPVCAPRIGTL